MYKAPIYVEAAPVANFPERVDVRWEMESRLMWNEKERINEEKELIYEVSWIPELGVWRAFSGRGRERRDHSRTVDSKPGI
jgi:hypothetical protein